MKACKDCIHYEVIKTESSSYCLCSKAFKMSERRRHDSTIECEYFKDKSKIIDLPCAVGDTVYVIYYVRKSCNSCDRYSDFYGLDPICDEHKILFPNINDDKKNICNKELHKDDVISNFITKNKIEIDEPISFESEVR